VVVVPVMGDELEDVDVGSGNGLEEVPFDHVAT
jgi:hypothetical protein